MIKLKQYIKTINKLSIKLFRKVFGYCDYCNRYFTYPKRRRTNTAFVDDDMNFEYSCIDCFAEHDKYWEERWEDYYRSIR